MAKDTKLKRHLRQRGLPQNQLSYGVHIPQADISQIVNGKKYCPPAWRKKISDFLGVDEKQLFEEV